MLGSPLAFMMVACSLEKAPPPSILIVVMDTVRADALGAYGNTRQISPQFDAVAQAGALFTDVTAPAAWTWPSHASLFTGEAPWVHGAHTAWRDDGVVLDNWLQVSPMRADLPTLAGRLAEAGYATSAFFSNNLLAPERGLTRDFEHTEYHDADPSVTRAVARWIRGDEPRPQLVFVNYMRAHSPYNLAPASWALPYQETLTPEGAPDWLRPYLNDPFGVSFFQDRSAALSGLERFAKGELAIDDAGLTMLRDLYQGEVMLVDAEVNALMRAWVARYPAGVVIVTSDHGELLGEHALIGHGSYVYSRLTRVPLALAAPGVVAAGTTSAVPVQLQDIYDTVLELAGVEDAPWTLLDALEGKPRPEPILAAEWPRQRYAEVVGGRLSEGWRLMRDGSIAVVAGTGGSLELYDLAADPWMDHNLAPQRREAALALAAEAERLAPIDLSVGGMALTDEQAEQLRTLGYVDR